MKLLVALLFVSSLHAATWFVRGTASCANNGNGTAAGCAASPGAAGAWRGLSNISWASMAATDTLILASVANEDYGNNALSIQKSGSSTSSRFTITTQIGAGAVASWNFNDVANSVGIRQNDNNFITVDGRGNKLLGTPYTIVINHFGSNTGGTNSYGYYENDNTAAHDMKVLGIEFCSDGQNGADDNSSGVYIQNPFTDATKFVEVANNYVHSCAGNANISSITRSGTTATVTLTTPSFPSSGTFLMGIKHPAVIGYDTCSGAGACLGSTDIMPGRWVATMTSASTFTYSNTNVMTVDGTEQFTTGLSNAGAGGFASLMSYTTGLHVFSPRGQANNFTMTLVHDNWVENMWHDGIRCQSNCSVYNNVIKHVDGSGHSDSILIQSAGTAAIFGNYVEDSFDQNLYLDNIYNAKCSHFRIYNNVFNSFPGIGMNADPEGGADASTAPFETCTGTSVGLDDVEIINNTWFTSSVANVRNGRGTATLTNFVILNNLFSSGKVHGETNIDLNPVTITNSTSWDFNAYNSNPITNFTGSQLNITQMRGLTPARETNGEIGSATYVNAFVPTTWPPTAEDYHLSAADTVATLHGVNLSSAYPFVTTDKDGKSRPAAGSWDLGAYVSGSISASPSPLAFGNQATRSTSTTLTETIVNNSASSMTSVAFSVVGTNFGDFSCAAGTLGSTLATGATGTILCSFSPTATGSRSANIQVTYSGATGSPLTIPLTGTGIPSVPTTSYAPTSLSFPSTNLTVTSSALNIVLTNTGNANLTSISLATTGNFAVSSTTPATNCGGTLAVNATCTIAITFTPASAGLLSGTLRVTSNAASSVDVLNLSGTGFDPTAINVIQTVSCGGQSFPGTCAIAATTAGDLLVATGCSAFSTGTGTTISSITDNKSDTWAEAGSARSLDTNSASICDIWYSATVPAGVTTLTITPSATVRMAWVIREIANVNTLDQTAVLNSQASAASPSGASVTIATAKEFIASALNPFGSVTGGHAGNTCTNDSLVFSDGWSHLITTTTGTYSCQWDLSSAATSNSSTASFKQVAGGSPVVSLGVSSLTFGGLQTLQTTSPSLTVTLTNNGTASLTITSIVLGGTNPGDFSQSTTCGGSLAVNVSCTVTETFKPTAAGVRSGSVAFTTNAATSPDTVTLTGTAIVQPTSFGGATVRGVH